MSQFERMGVLEDKEGMKANPDDYDVGLVIAHDAPSGARGLDLERASLKLRYWVILTNKRDVFPKLKLEKKLGVFKSSSTRTFSASKRGRSFVILYVIMNNHLRSFGKYFVFLLLLFA